MESASASNSSLLLPGQSGSELAVETPPYENDGFDVATDLEEEKDSDKKNNETIRDIKPSDHLIRVQKYLGVNPFVSRTNVHSCYQTFKVIFFTVTLIAPLRFLGIIICILLIGLTAFIGTLGTSFSENPKPFGPLRRAVLFPIRILMRAIMLFAGFYWIPVKDHRKASKDGRRGYSVIVANHVSVFDTCKILLDEGSSIAAKAELFHIPVVGTGLRGLQTVPIYRGTAEGRKKSMEALKARMSDSNFPPLLIFPEGTTSSDCVMTMFKPGPFLMGENVLPVCLNYTANKHFDLFLGNEHNIVYYMYMACCQFINYLSVEYLEVYEPTQEEKQNPALYAENVRNRMAEALHVECTPHDFADVSLFVAAQRARMSFNFLAKDVKDALELSSEETAMLMKRFKTMVKDQDHIDYATFCKYTQMKEDFIVARRLFDFMDSDHNGLLDFGEYLAAMSVCTKRNFDIDRLHVVFLLADTKGKDIITRESFRHLIDIAEQTLSGPAADPTASERRGRLTRRSSVSNLPTPSDLELMFQLVFPDDSNEPLTFSQFASRLDQHPECGAHLLKVFLLKRVGGL